MTYDPHSLRFSFLRQARSEDAEEAVSITFERVEPDLPGVFGFTMSDDAARGIDISQLTIYRSPYSQVGWMNFHFDCESASGRGEMFGRMKPEKRLVEIEPDQLRSVGLAIYEFKFKPLLAFAMQFPPFVRLEVKTRRKR